MAKSSVGITVLMLMVSSAVIAAAEDNPFGLPPPHDPQRPGAVVLHGGGYGLSKEIRQEFIRLAGGRDARILLVPSDEMQRSQDAHGRPAPIQESAENYRKRLSAVENYGQWVALKKNGEVADFQFLYRDDEDDPKDERFYNLMEQATGIWLPAYDQEWLPKVFADKYPDETSRFQLALMEIVARGGVVGGLAGGMASFPETVIAGDPTDESGKLPITRFGLALMRGAIVDHNFNARSGRLERLTNLLRNGPRLDRLAGEPGVTRRSVGLGVEQQTVLILSGNTIRALGDGRGHIFLKSNGDRTITWQTMAAGDDPLVIQSSASHPPHKDAGTLPEEGSFNPFGLPEAADPKRPGTVVLHGGRGTDEIIDLYPQLAGTPKPRVVHCPSARESCRPQGDDIDPALAAHLEETFSEWHALQTEGRVEEMTFITTNNPAAANSAEFVRPLTQADALWFCGGDQFHLARLYVDPLRPTLFQQEVWQIVRRGGVVGGSSAGLAVMADVMIEGGEPEDGSPAEAKLSRGLGVMKHVLAEQHFDARSGRIERLTGLLRDHKRLANFAPTCRPKQMLGLAVEENTALIVQESRLRVSGKKLAHVFLQSADPRRITWHALKPGDVAILRPGRNGYQLELEDWEFRDPLPGP